MKTRILFYHSYLSEMGGVETFTYNFCYLYKDYFDITVLYCSGKRKRINEMKKIVKLRKYDKRSHYDTDIYIRNSVWGVIPYNITFKYAIEMRHADYKYLFDRKLLNSQYRSNNIKNIVGCSKHVSKMSNLLFKDHPKTLYNPILPRYKTKRVYHFVSFMRISKDKGLDRMNKLYTMLKEANISFEWNIFTNTNFKSLVDEIHFWKARVGIENYIDYLVDADYSILLSDSEGCPYQVLESLSYKVPVIATDIPSIHELIKDKVNGYIVPLDMNFDINIIKNIPKIKDSNYLYENNIKWLEYLKEIERNIK